MNKLFSKVAALSVGLAMAIGVGVAVGSKEAKVVKAETYTLITSNSSLSNGDSVVLATKADNAPETGVTGFNGNKDATVSTTESAWKKYTVGSASSSGWTLYDEDAEQYIASPTANEFKYSASGGTCSVTSAGVISCNSRELAVNGTSYRFYGSTQTYERFYVWKVSGGSTTTYTISYDANGGTGTMSDSVGSNPSVAACTFTAPNGKVFSKWNTAANGSGTDYAAGDKPGKDLSLYAIWAVSESILIEASSTDQLSVSPWSVNNNPTGIETSSYSRGWQWGNGTSAVITYTSSQAFKKVVVGASTNGASTSLAVAVGGVAFGDSQSVTSGTAAAKTDYTFEGSGTGNVVITLTNTATKSAYINKIELFFDDGPDPSKKNMVIYTSGNPADGETIGYSKNAGTHVFSALEGEDPVSSVSWSTSDSTVATINASTGAMTTVKPGNVIVYAEAEGYNKASAAVEITKGWLEELTLTGSMSKTSYYVGESWSHEGFVLTATYHYGWEEDVSAEASWDYNPASPALNVTSVTATVTFGEEDPIVSAPQSVTVSRTNPLMTLYSLADSTAVDVYGVYVGYQEGSGPIIMDGAYGMLCYFGKYNPHDVSGYTEGETVLHVTGSMATYNELRQISSPTISVASGTYDAPETPVVYAAKGGETVEYSSRLTTVTGTAVCTKNDFSGDPGAKDITMSFTVGSNTIQVFYKMAAQSSDTAAYQAMKDAVANETEITVKGFTSWYNGFQVQMNGYVPPAEGYTAEDFAQDLLDQTDLVCAGWEEGDNNHDALEAIWSNLASNDKYPSLPGAEKTKLAEAERDEEGTVIEQAMARYDFLTGKYDLSNFINGRTPIVPANGRYGDISSITSDNTMIIVVTIASVSALTFTMLLVFKKKKQK